MNIRERLMKSFSYFSLLNFYQSWAIFYKGWVILYDFSEKYIKNEQNHPGF